MKKFTRHISGIVVATLAAGCTAPVPITRIPAPEVLQAYVIRGPATSRIARAIIGATACPTIVIDDVAQSMHLRAAAETVAPRQSDQADRKAAAFPVTVCELVLPETAHAARIGNTELALGTLIPNRIVLIADTGCRMKASERAFQDCSDASTWPLARVARSAAALHPDLVIHLGDYHYRESPCPVQLAGCANSPWGFGADAWFADFLTPARALLNAAPWVFVRGNHETCARAGQGWFRFLDSQPWQRDRSCDLPANDSVADFTDPYGVTIGPDRQLIVFDSAKVSAKPYAPGDAGFARYLEEFRQVDGISQAMQHDIFLSHHPVLGLGPARPGDKIAAANRGLQSVMKQLHPKRLFPSGVDLAAHGHVHLFEAIGFKTDHPTTLVVGNSGSATEGSLPEHLPPDTTPYAGAQVADFSTRVRFGFAVLEREARGEPSWTVTEYDADGLALSRCVLEPGRLRCSRNR